MNYEKEYIDLLIEEVKSFPKVKPILESYLLNKIEFSELTTLISKEDTGVTPWYIFKKDKDIDNLFI